MDLPDWLLSKETARHWRRLGFTPRFGICTPLGSIRSQRDCGVGDIGDIFSLVDFACACGATLLQFLPLNDVGGGCVPYAAISAFALDAIYVALDRVQAVREDPELMRRVKEIGQRYNKSTHVRFEEVKKEKVAILDEAFSRMKGPWLRDELESFAAARPWLEKYALFRVIREREDLRSWEEWLPKYAQANLEKVRDECGEELEKVVFEQWVLESQWREALDYAHSRGVFIVGDVPILVGRDSADVFENPELFLLETSAGAPPDMYSEDGQAWGFPTYNWPAHRAQNFEWWRARLKHLERFYDLYRIDHVVGFFRIWTLPKDARSGKVGRFVPEDESAWGEQGREILKVMLDSTEMLPLAEDLGTIPPICRDVLAEMGICGLKVQRWERDWHGDGHFIPPEEYPSLSVATLSTHDSETFAGWWEAYPEDRQRLYRERGFTGEAPAKLTPELHADFVRWISGAGSVFVILMIQDILAPLGLLPGDPALHRINVPGVVSDTNWRWRWPVGVESLLDKGCGSQVREWLEGRR